MKKLQVSIGDIYGYLEITEDLGLVEYGKIGRKQRVVTARCLNCGQQGKQYSLSNLRTNHTTSCGCFRKQKFTTHGMSTTRQYQIWTSMIQRCTSEKHKKYEYYGGRGISVCEKWLTFEGFWEDMSEGYSEELEIDRKDTDGNYSKENCRWVNRSENCYNKNIQSNNTSGKTGVTFNNKASKWQASIGINNESRYLGVFNTFEEAVAARKQAELEIYGYNKE